MSTRYYGSGAINSVRALTENLSSTHRVHDGIKRNATCMVKLLADSYNERGSLLEKQEESMRQAADKILSLFREGELSSERAKELIKLVDPRFYDEALFKCKKKKNLKKTIDDYVLLPWQRAAYQKAQVASSSPHPNIGSESETVSKGKTDTGLTLTLESRPVSIFAPADTCIPYTIINECYIQAIVNVPHRGSWIGGSDSMRVGPILTNDPLVFYSYPGFQYTITLGDRTFTDTLSKRGTLITILDQPGDIPLSPMVECPCTRKEKEMTPTSRWISVNKDQYC